MRILRLMTLFVVFFSVEIAMADKPVITAAPVTIDYSAPPFWLASYDEFKNLKQQQKAFYLGKLYPEFNKIPALKATTRGALIESSRVSDQWLEIRKKLYEYCADKSVVKTCDEIADLRVQALNYFKAAK